MRRFRRVRVPEAGPPLLRRLFAEMNAQRVGMGDLAARSGVSAVTLSTWSGGCPSRPPAGPTLANIEACFNVLGLRLVATRAPLPGGGAER